MRYKASFVTGFGAGYVLGAKAGRQRYEQIMKIVRDFKEKPAVQQTAGVVQAQASDLAESAKRVVTDKVGGRSSGTDVGTASTTGTSTSPVAPPAYPVAETPAYLADTPAYPVAEPPASSVADTPHYPPSPTVLPDSPLTDGDTARH